MAWVPSATRVLGVLNTHIPNGMGGGFCDTFMTPIYIKVASTAGSPVAVRVILKRPGDMGGGSRTTVPS